MYLNVFSWNMQGWGNQYQGEAEDAKIYALLRSMQDFPRDSRIIMLQECGNPNKTGLTGNSIWTGPDGEDYTCLSIPDPTATNKRCTTAILVSKNLTVDACGMSVPNGVTRPMVYVVVDGLCLATMHAIANNAYSVSDVKGAIKELASENLSWVLMGDFNSQPNDYTAGAVPEKLNDVIITGTVSRPEYSCKMIYSKNPTQGPNGTRTASLDFAFICNGIDESNIIPPDGDINTKVINIKQFAGPGKYLSDHNLIGLQLTNE